MNSTHRQWQLDEQLTGMMISKLDLHSCQNFFFLLRVHYTHNLVVSHAIQSPALDMLVQTSVRRRIATVGGRNAVLSAKKNPTSFEYESGQQFKVRRKPVPARIFGAVGHQQ
jgi:hypothetical protein